MKVQIPLRTAFSHDIIFDIKDVINIQTRENAKWKRFRTSELYETFKAARAAVNARIRRSKSMFYDKIFRPCIDLRKKWMKIHNLCLVNCVSDSSQEINVHDVNHVPLPPLDINFQNSIRFNQRQTHEFNFMHFRQDEVLRSFIDAKSNAIAMMVCIQNLFE